MRGRRAPRFFYETKRKASGVQQMAVGCYQIVSDKVTEVKEVKEVEKVKEVKEVKKVKEVKDAKEDASCEGQQETPHTVIVRCAVSIWTPGHHPKGKAKEQDNKVPQKRDPKKRDPKKRDAPDRKKNRATALARFNRMPQCFQINNFMFNPKRDEGIAQLEKV
jgi:hypothetical protein